jgi:hypothetical protein
MIAIDGIRADQCLDASQSVGEQQKKTTLFGRIDSFPSRSVQDAIETCSVPYHNHIDLGDSRRPDFEGGNTLDMLIDAFLCCRFRPLSKLPTPRFVLQLRQGG